MSDWQQSQTLPEIVNEQRDGNKLALELYVPAILFQFRGHFDEFPVLPGVAQLDWAALFSREKLGIDRDIAEVAQLKFRALIQPETRLTLTLVYQLEKNRVSFEYRHQQTVFSSGLLKLAQP